MDIVLKSASLATPRLSTETVRMAAAILAAGVVGAVVEMIVVLPIQAQLGNSPRVVFQCIACGWLGKAAFSGGDGAALLGVAIHLLVSLGAALVYALAGRFWEPGLLKRPWVNGLLFGALSFVFMTYIVLPITPIGYAPIQPLSSAWMSLAVHMAAFGLPISLVISRMLGQRA